MNQRIISLKLSSLLKAANMLGSSTRKISAKRRYRIYKRWKRWLKQIQEDITNLSVHRHIYNEVAKIIKENPRLQVASSFYDWMRIAYIYEMSIRVRRLVDRDRRSVSFVRLMEEIEQCPGVISRRRFVQLYSQVLRYVADRDFERFAKPGASHVNPAAIHRDKRALIKAAGRLRLFVNRHIAHRSRRPLRRLPTFAELDVCINLLEQLLKKYVLMLEATGLIEVLPVWQYDWKQVFRIPWIP